jgi:hypothetical protein
MAAINLTTPQGIKEEDQVLGRTDEAPAHTDTGGAKPRFIPSL